MYGIVVCPRTLQEVRQESSRIPDYHTNRARSGWRRKTCEIKLTDCLDLSDASRLGVKSFVCSAHCSYFACEIEEKSSCSMTYGSDYMILTSGTFFSQFSKAMFYA